MYAHHFKPNHEKHKQTLVNIIPKQPYIDWTNSFDLGPSNIYSTALLLPNKYDKHNFEDFIKKSYGWIFEQRLKFWMVMPDVWPENRSYEKFNEWFDVRVVELDTAPIFAE